MHEGTRRRTWHHRGVISDTCTYLCYPIFDAVRALPMAVSTRGTLLLRDYVRQSHYAREVECYPEACLYGAPHKHAFMTARRT